MRSPKTKSVIKDIPDDRLLLESDLENIDNFESDLNNMINIISECKGWSINETILKTNENAIRFYNSL